MGQVTSIVTATSTVIVPAGIFDAEINVVGGGQAGAPGVVGNLLTPLSGNGGAGGNGGYWAVKYHLRDLVPGMPLFVSVGAGGVASALAGVRTPGGDTFVTLASGIELCRAPGGGSLGVARGDANFAGGVGATTLQYPIPMGFLQYGGLGGGGAGGPNGVGGRGGWANSAQYAVTRALVPGTWTQAVNAVVNLNATYGLTARDGGGGGGEGNGGYDAGGVLPYVSGTIFENPNTRPGAARGTGGKLSGNLGGPGGDGYTTLANANGKSGSLWFSLPGPVVAAPGGGGAGSLERSAGVGSIPYTDFQQFLEATASVGYGATGGAGGNYGGGGAGGSAYTSNDAVPLGGAGAPGVVAIIFRSVGAGPLATIIVDLPELHYPYHQLTLGPR